MKKTIACIIILSLNVGCVTGYLPFTTFSPVDIGKSLIHDFIVKYKKDENGKKRNSESLKITVESQDDVSPLQSPDVIDLSQVVWLDADVSTWPVTHDLSISFNGDDIVYNTEATSEWPKKFMGDVAKGGYLVGNPWIFIERDGKWHGMTYEWLRKGQKSKPLHTVKGDHIKKTGWHSWAPTDGQRYAFMLSGLARNSDRNIEARTPAVFATWPK